MTGFDIIVLLVVAVAAAGGFLRGFVQEVLSLLAWGVTILAIHNLHTPLYNWLVPLIGNAAGAATLAFAVLLLIPYAGMKLIAGRLGDKSRTSLLGPIDRVLGFGFGAIKGAIVVTCAFAILVLGYDATWGIAGRPDWIKTRADISAGQRQRRRARPVDRRPQHEDRRPGRFAQHSPAMTAPVIAPGAARGGSVLYTPEILALAVSLADWPLDKDAECLGDARSVTCGSTVAFSCALDADGRIWTPGLRASACAIGQAAAALFIAHATGRGRDEIAAARDEIARWLSQGGLLPDWPGILALEPARAYPARHGAILLAWNAALAALPKETSAS